MKKGTLICILLVVLLIVVICVTGVSIIGPALNRDNPSSGNPDNYIVNSNGDNNTTVTDVSLENIKYPYIEDAELNTEEVSMLASSEVTPGQDKTIDGVTYKDINTATTDVYSIVYSDQTADFVKDDNGKYVSFSDSPFVQFADHNRLFNLDKEIIPKKLYLTDDSINAFYDYKGEVYYIPVEKVDDKEQERIEYRDYNFIVMRNSGKISFNGKDIAVDYTYSNDGLIDEEVDILFDAYYSIDPKVEVLYKVYETDLDNDEKTKEIYYYAFGKIDNKSVLTHTFLKSLSNGSVSKFILPADVASNYSNYDNIFLIRQDNRISITNISKEYLPLSYYIYAKDPAFGEQGFEKVFKLANGKSYDALVGETITLNKDYSIADYEIDGKYNKSVSGDSIELIKYVFSYEEKIEDKLPEGTKLTIKEILNAGENAILEDENGVKYILNKN